MNVSENKSSPPRILVIDDEDSYRTLIDHELSKLGYIVATAVNGREALEKVRRERFDLAISDVNVSSFGGIEFLESLKKENPSIEVIMATEGGTVETAVAAMKKGAYAFVQKPFNLPEVLALIEKALEKRDLKAILGVYQASKAVFSSVKLHKLLPVIMELALKILNSDDAFILLKRDDGHVHLESSLVTETDGGKNQDPPRAEELLSQCSQLKEPVIHSSSIICPLRLEDEFLGVLSVNRVKISESFSSSDLCNVTILGSQIAQAVCNAYLYEKLENKVDELKTAYGKLEEIQAQLIQSEKLGALGQLAAGVAHELNNPLTGIMGFSQMVLENNGLPTEAREDIESIYLQSQRCRSIIQNLLQFSRRRKVKKEPLNLESVLEATLQLVRYDLMSNNIAVVTEFPKELPDVIGDASQLQQVFLNLITNALQAMENKKERKLTIKVSHDFYRVLVCFIDTGAGISKEHMAKIFDPFFTTKPIGKGTGLGLSISYGIIHQLQGKMYVESELGSGTSFFIELPAHCKQAKMA